MAIAAYEHSVQATSGGHLAEIDLALGIFLPSCLIYNTTLLSFPALCYKDTDIEISMIVRQDQVYHLMIAAKGQV